MNETVENVGKVKGLRLIIFKNIMIDISTHSSKNVHRVSMHIPSAVGVNMKDLLK